MHIRVSFRVAATALSIGAVACGGARPSSPGASATSAADTASAPSAADTASAPAVTGKPSEDLIPREVLFGNPDRANPQISPDGSQLSWLAARNGVLNVWVAPADDLDAARPVTADDTRPVRSYFWAYTNEHIVYLQDAGGDENWHAFVVDLDSGETTDLTPMDNVQARIAKVSAKHPDEIVLGINDRNPQLHDLYKVDLRTGERTLLARNPGFVSYRLDDDLRVRFASRMRPDGGTTVMRPTEDSAGTAQPKGAAAQGTAAPPTFDGWEPFMDIPQEDGLTTGLLGVTRSGRGVYAFDSRGRDTAALTRIDIASGESEVLAAHDSADPGDVHLHPTDKTVLAVSFDYTRSEWEVLAPAVEDDYARLAEVSEGDLSVADTTLDHDTWLVRYVQDDGPVRYYRYDRDEERAEFLFTNRDELEDLELADMHPVVIEARDGLELVSYLSVPPEDDPDGDARPDDALPTVLLVHGGPWSRDSWGYDALHQLLADRGYAVLSVNYRGSTGFGKEFINAGNMEWAGKMHDDLIDAVDWAVDEGVADEDRVCIMGGSYGGYATLVGLTFTPETFACGVDIVGPSSLITLLEAIPPYWKPMQNLFKTRVGDWESENGRERLRERSPLSRVDAIERPLLIAQGANDPRVPQAESDQIVKAMNTNDIPVSYVLFPDEGHGVARRPNRLALFAAAEAFLSAHIGGHYQPARAEGLEGTTVEVPAGVRGIPGFPEVVGDLEAARKAE